MLILTVLQQALELEQKLHPVLQVLQARLTSLTVPTTQPTATPVVAGVEVVTQLVAIALKYLTPGGQAAEVLTDVMTIEKLLAPLVRVAVVAVGDTVASVRTTLPDDGVSYPLPGDPQ